MSFIILISIGATIADASTPDRDEKSLLLCFSLKKNCQQLFTFKRDSNDIATVHGIRMLNSIMLLLSHKSMAMFFSPYTNRYVHNSIDKHKEEENIWHNLQEVVGS